MNIYIFELKTYLKSALLWSAAISAFIFMVMSFYPGMMSDAELMDQVLASFPEEFLKAFGMAGAISISSVVGFFAFAFVFVQLLLAMQSANYGIGVLSVEERELTADFLMTRPISRTRIILSKFLAVMTALTITNLFVWLSSIGGILIFNNGNEYSFKTISLILSANILFQLYFVSIGMIISVLVKKIRSVLSFSMALSFGMYAIFTIGEVLDTVNFGVISPFYHYDPSYISLHGKYNLMMTLLSCVIIAVCFGLSYILYRNRNIHTV